MRWRSSGRSRDIEDRRGRPALARRGLSIGLGGLAVLVVLTLVTGEDFLSLAGPGGGGVAIDQPTAPPAGSPGDERLVDFVSFVLDDTQDTWTSLLGDRYRRARLVLFTDMVDSACGFAQAATGPFYCPGDQRVYIDLGFYRELRDRFGAPGDFAQAYVLAHEIGHHVQAVVGTEAAVRRAQQDAPANANALSVRLELQADCYAGVWGASAATRGILEAGDIEEGLTAAAAIGDDRIQRMAGGRVSPERFTHGSSAERVQWLRRGIETGDPNACDTFGGP